MLDRSSACLLATPSLSSSRAISSLSLVPVSVGAPALEIANCVRQMDAFEFLSILRHMLDELETRLLRAEALQRSLPQRSYSGRSSLLVTSSNRS